MQTDTDGTQDVSAARRLWVRRRRAMERSGCRYTPIGTFGTGGPRAFNSALNIFAKLLRVSGLFHLGHRNAHQVRVKHLDFSFSNLPREFDGYRILHLTDLHIDEPAGIGKVIAGKAQGLKPDLCVMTGDFRSDDDGGFEQIMKPMARLIDAIGAKDGVVTVLGNHDDHAMGLAFEERLGMRLLANERIRIMRGGSAITISGADDVNRFYTPDAANILTEPVNGFGLALVHSPEMADEAAQGGHALYLCGHTHGGQIALPGGRPIVTHLNRNEDLASGLWAKDGMIGYTSPGAGVSGPPVRFFTRGEITMITLKRG